MDFEITAAAGCIGTLAFWSRHVLGEVRYSARVGVRDFSPLERNEYGEMELIRSRQRQDDVAANHRRQIYSLTPPTCCSAA